MPFQVVYETRQETKFLNRLTLENGTKYREYSLIAETFCYIDNRHVKNIAIQVLELWLVLVA